jgi:pectin methylesterase-like acyl-CoA thioesterase
MSIIKFIRRLLGITKRQIMSIQAKIAADQESITAARAALDAANAQLASDQAALAALAPHIAAWDAVEAFANTVAYDDIKSELLALVATGRAALDL